MAIRHGLAGQYGKGEARRRAQWMLSALLGAGIYGTGAVGFAMGYLWANWGPTLASVGLLVLAGALALAWRPIGRYMDRLARKRIKFLRGGQVEGLVGWLLEDLGDEWHIFNGVKLEAESDIDHVLVGPGGVYCISTKSLRGLFHGTADGLLYNGERSEFARLAMRQAMNLKDRMEGIMGKDVPWVQPVLAVPLGYVQGDACGGKVWVVHQDDILERIGPERGAKRLSREEVVRVVKVTEMIQAGAAEVYRRVDRVQAS